MNEDLNPGLVMLLIPFRDRLGRGYNPVAGSRILYRLARRMDVAA